MSHSSSIFALVCVATDVAVGLPADCVTVRRDGLLAVCMRHDAALLVGEVGERNLADPKVVTELAIAHAKLIDRVWRQTPVMPVAFGSLFHDVRSVEKLLVAEHGSIARYLNELTGHQEWGIKATIDARTARQNFADRAVNDAGLDPNLSPGARYFKDQAIRKKAMAGFAGAMEDRCMLLQLKLTGLTTKLVRRSIIPRQDDRQTVASWAVLVGNDQFAILENSVAQMNSELEPEQIKLELTGPWPAWSFVPKIG